MCSLSRSLSQFAAQRACRNEKTALPTFPLRRAFRSDIHAPDPSVNRGRLGEVTVATAGLTEPHPSYRTSHLVI